MKHHSANMISKKILTCLAIGLMVAALSGLYGRTVLHQHCSTGKDSDVIECSLEGTERGLPFAYVLPRLPHSKFKATTFIEDGLIWSVVPVVVMFKSKRKATHG